jgi:hypothetical protein
MAPRHRSLQGENTVVIQRRSIGRAQPQDLAAIFAGAVVGRQASVRGPGELEGSIVNRITAPIFQLIGERSGFEGTDEPFAYREGSNFSVHGDACRHPRGDDDDHGLATEARDAGFGAVVA